MRSTWLQHSPTCSGRAWEITPTCCRRERGAGAGWLWQLSRGGSRPARAERTTLPSARLRALQRAPLNPSPLPPVCAAADRGGHRRQPLLPGTPRRRHPRPHGAPASLLPANRGAQLGRILNCHFIHRCAYAACSSGGCGSCGSCRWSDGLHIGPADERSLHRHPSPRTLLPAPPCVTAFTLCAHSFVFLHMRSTTVLHHVITQLKPSRQRLPAWPMRTDGAAAAALSWAGTARTARTCTPPAGC